MTRFRAGDLAGGGLHDGLRGGLARPRRPRAGVAAFRGGDFGGGGDSSFSKASSAATASLYLLRMREGITSSSSAMTAKYIYA